MSLGLDSNLEFKLFHFDFFSFERYRYLKNSKKN